MIDSLERGRCDVGLGLRENTSKHVGRGCNLFLSSTPRPPASPLSTQPGKGSLCLASCVTKFSCVCMCVIAKGEIEGDGEDVQTMQRRPPCLQAATPNSRLPVCAAGICQPHYEPGEACNDLAWFCNEAVRRRLGLLILPHSRAFPHTLLALERNRRQVQRRRVSM